MIVALVSLDGRIVKQTGRICVLGHAWAWNLRKLCLGRRNRMSFGDDRAIIDPQLNLRSLAQARGKNRGD